MPQATRIVRALWRRVGGIPQGCHGGVAVEFALIAPLLLVLTIGALDLSSVLLTWILMESSIREASRYGITGPTATETTDGLRLDQIKNIIAEKTLGLVDVDKATIDVRSYPTADDVGKPEPFTDSSPKNGTYDQGEAFTDCNGSGNWESDRGRRDSPGASGQIVVYTVSFDCPLLTPLLKGVIGTNGKVPLSATVTVRNEPWDPKQTAEDNKTCGQ